MTVSGTDRNADDVRVRGALGALRSAVDEGVLVREALERILAQLALPARCYRLVMEKVSESGIQIVDIEVAEPDGEGGRKETSGWNRNGYDHFIKRNWHDVLTAEEEHDLGVKVQQGRLAHEALESGTVPQAAVRELRRRVRIGDRAAEDFVMANLRLVSKLAAKLHKRTGPALELEDLFQEGVLGLSHAISKFEPERGFKLSTYATWWIRQSMDRAVDNQERAIRLPVHVWEKTRRVWRAERELQAQGRSHGAKEIASEVGLPVDEVREYQAVGRRVGSLDRRIGDGVATIGDLVPDPNGTDPADIVEFLGLRDEIEQRLATLPERDRQIMILRFGIGEVKGRTLEEVGTAFGLTRERIRQIEAKSLEHLRIVDLRDAAHNNGVSVRTSVGKVRADVPSRRPSDMRAKPRSEVGVKPDLEVAAGRASAPADPRPEVPDVGGDVSYERQQRWVTVAELFPDGLIG